MTISTDHSQPWRLVGGRERQGILIPCIEKTHYCSEIETRTWAYIANAMVEGSSTGILLSDNLSEKALRILLERGLANRFISLYEPWLHEFEKLREKHKRNQEDQAHDLEVLINRHISQIQNKLLPLAHKAVAKHYPWIMPPNLDWHEGEAVVTERNEFPNQSESFIMNADWIEATIEQEMSQLQNHFSNYKWDRHFRAKKELYAFINDPKIPPRKQKSRSVRPVLLEHAQSQSSTWYSRSWSLNFSTPEIVSSTWSRLSNRFGIADDTGHTSPLDETEDRCSVGATASRSDIDMDDSEQDLLSRARSIVHFACKESAMEAAEIVTTRMREEQRAHAQILRTSDTSLAWKSLTSSINDALRRVIKREIILIHDVVQEQHNTSVVLQTVTMPLQRNFLMLHELSLGIDGGSSLHEICPIECPNAEFLIHIQFVGRDRYLTLVRDEATVVQLSPLGSKYRRHAPLRLPRLESTFLFDFDEASARLAFVTNDGNVSRLEVYQSDMQKFSSLFSISLQVFPFEIRDPFTYIRFVPDGKYLVFVDSIGQMALYSLSSNQFRQSKVSLGGQPTSVECLPDGSCILVGKTNSTEETIFEALHLASFGRKNSGFLLTPHLPAAKDRLIFATVGSSQSTHLISLIKNEIRTYSLRITTKSSNYKLTSSGEIERLDSVAESSLIHCFTEVWTRYPIVSAVDSERHRAVSRGQPPHVLFVTSADPSLFVQEFSNQVTEFKMQQHKPTGDRLSTLKCSARTNFDAIECSEFRFGDWLIGFFCLIPLHIAVTNANHFVALKDGSSSTEFRELLSGVSVGEIATSLSFGWYESIFASYFARKPVRVISSMGEQSVGKSYALNHLADTSFAGSAMRCTEGVWLSVTPCTDELLVTLDFEGINSMERSVQEDTLLILFQTAISNLVLFHSDSAMTRNINKLFSSFQSSSTHFKTEANPTLFQSTLALIIRDVPEEDKAGVVEEFDEKLGRIVAEERSGNFISQLHRGNVIIVPWPSMASPAFYHMFENIKQHLLGRPAVYTSGGEFLGVLKMLMAKIQACDWDAIENSLGAQRAKFLSTNLSDALMYGRTDSSKNGLTILDTDELIHKYTAEDPVFTLSQELADSSICFRALCRQWSKYKMRFEMNEDEFIAQLGVYLQLQAENRVELGEKWINQNTTRFQACSEVQELYSTFKKQAQTIRSQAILCGAPCEKCSRRCVNTQRHSGQHDCTTDHKCSCSCSFQDEHDGSMPSCMLPALHSGKHICHQMNHQCREKCHLFGLGNCLETCTKPIDHPDGEHMCAAGRHTCSEMCNIASSNLLLKSGDVACRGKCDIEYNEPHVSHTCARSGCALDCRLCGWACANKDHLHGLQENAIHLCSAEHECQEECSMPGICKVESVPRSVEEPYVGALESFRYTWYTQEAHKLPCAIPLPPGSSYHDGPHRHKDDFHFCNARCPQCDYYCTLPLGHPAEQGHKTSHGNMGKTKWRIEGENITVLGQKYADGDPGVTMMCSVVCSELGRHVHLAPCQGPGNQCSGGDELEHIPESDIRGQTHSGFDWVSHKLFWERLGFQDPYGRQQQSEFAKCDHECPGNEHKGADSSYCILPLFHPPVHEDAAHAGQYISTDKHVFQCDNPSHPPCHIIFAIDRSWSMSDDDRVPETQWPDIPPISNTHRNRYGAVLSALYGFLKAVQKSRMARQGSRRDAYSCVLFDDSVTVPFIHNEVHSNEELLRILIEQPLGGGTDFNKALEKVKEVMETKWSLQRLPVVIFLSDGEDSIEAGRMRKLCESAVEKGQPLAFYSVSFGIAKHTGVLRNMAEIARSIYASAGVGIQTIPCLYQNALSTVQLDNVFLEIAKSLKSQRPTLIPK